MTPEIITQQLNDASIALYNDSLRTHLGASKIGEHCLRKLFYGFRHCDNIIESPETYRRFNRGKKEEATIYELFEKAGWKIVEKQGKFSDVGGHFGGSHDGIIESPCGERYLLEIKTTKSIKCFSDKFGIKGTFTLHYAQINVYMQAFGLKKCIYICVDKTTEEFYIEIVNLDESVANTCIDKAFDVINMVRVPKRATNDSTFYLCKNMCNYYDICFKDKPYHVCCRSCRHASPVENAQWECGKYGIIPTELMPNGCVEWETL